MKARSKSKGSGKKQKLAAEEQVSAACSLNLLLLKSTTNTLYLPLFLSIDLCAAITQPLPAPLPVHLPVRAQRCLFFSLALCRSSSGRRFSFFTTNALILLNHQQHQPHHSFAHLHQPKHHKLTTFKHKHTHTNKCTGRQVN